ncbi:MAG: ComEC/Rec2 family competence protein [Verrucomicrobiota bacterium]
MSALVRFVTQLALATVLAVAGPSRARGTPPGLRVDFIDVGQGDAALVTSPAGKTVLIDGGPANHAAALTAFLAAHVHGPLDLILLSHRHEDHLGGLPAVVRRTGARLFLDAPAAHAGPDYAALVHELEARGIPARQATRGRRIDLGGGAVITLLGPPDPPITGSRSDVNANSVVARLTFGSVSMLFAGDAETPTEAWLLASGEDLRADVLKVAHHGSRYASGARFLRAVRPRVAVISAGAGNEYGHPAPLTLARLGRLGVSVYRTDLDGDVTVETDGAAIRVRTARTPSELSATP